MSQQPEWNAQYQRYFYTLWNEQHQLYYWTHHVEGQWVFFDWVPTSQPRVEPHHRSDSGYHPSNAGFAGAQTAGPASVYSKEGPKVEGSYNTSNPQAYESLDPSFRVQQSDYFREGRMFAILFIEPAGKDAVDRITFYNDNRSNLTQVQYGQWAHSQVRRFIIVRRRQEYCFAVPVFTYGNQGTTKPGVRPDEHAIAYSCGQSPRLVPGEQELQKSPIPVVMNSGERPLAVSSRIYFGIHHPIQFNVKVKDLGYVHPEWLATFLGYWKMENGTGLEQDLQVTYDP